MPQVPPRFRIVGGDLFGALPPGVAGASIAGFTATNNGIVYNYASNLAKGVNLSTLTNWITATTDGTLAYGGGFTNSKFLDCR